MIEKASNTGKAKVSNVDERNLYQEMISLKSVKGTTWKDVGEVLARKQKNGSLSSSLDFSTISALHIGSKYAKLKNKFNKD